MWKKRVAWLLLLSAALLMYLFENNSGTRILLAALVLLPLGSGVALLLTRPKLTARLEMPETLNRGEGVLCALSLENGAMLPLSCVRGRLEICNLLTGEQSELVFTSAVGARGREVIRFSLEAAHCGTLTVQLGGLQMIDFFGLFSRRAACRAGRTAVVPPVTGPVELSMADTADFLLDGRQYSPQKPGYDPSETFRVREYAPGDPIRQIHWKLSQKIDTVLVRDFGLPVVDRMLLLLETTALDHGHVEPKAMDDLLDLLFSISQVLLTLDIPHTVGWRDHDTGGYVAQEIYNPEGLAELQGRVLSNKIGPGETTVAGCYGRCHAQCAYAHVAVFSPYMLPDLALLCHGNRVTQLLPRGSGAEDFPGENGAYLLPFSGEELRQGGLHLEL